MTGKNIKEIGKNIKEKGKNIREKIRICPKGQMMVCADSGAGNGGSELFSGRKTEKSWLMPIFAAACQPI